MNEPMTDWLTTLGEHIQRRHGITYSIDDVFLHLKQEQKMLNLTKSQRLTGHLRIDDDQVVLCSHRQPALRQLSLIDPELLGRLDRAIAELFGSDP